MNDSPHFLAYFVVMYLQIFFLIDWLFEYESGDAGKQLLWQVAIRIRVR